MDKQAIIEELRHCANNDCDGCPYKEDTCHCLTKLAKDALELIEDGEGKQDDKRTKGV